MANDSKLDEPLTKALREAKDDKAHRARTLEMESVSMNEVQAPALSKGKQRSRGLPPK